jgi:glutamate-5-semialdehyde dehydrogenase
LTNASPLEAAQAARAASRTLAVLSVDDRNDALTAMHAALLGAKDQVLAANARDLEAARKAAESGEALNQSLVKRLDLGRAGKYDDMLQGILDVRELEDPSMHFTSLGCGSIADLSCSWQSDYSNASRRWANT